MDEGRLDRLEQALLLHAKGRQASPPPEGFTAGVMREVRARAERRVDFRELLGAAMRRFAPAGAVAAAAACAYAQASERLMNQVLLALTLNGGPQLLAGLMP